MNQIVTNNLSKIYNENKENAVQALKEVNIVINKGDMVAIVGASGSGKSTLMHIIGCIDKQTEGSYFLNGKDIKDMNNSELAYIRNNQIGFVLQEFALLPYKKVWENVAIPMYFDKTKAKDIKTRALKQLRDLNIEELAYKKASQLSGGQKQRVAIARALINSPEIILADEPTGALDSKTAGYVLDILLNLNEQGSTVIIVTHNMEVANICSKVINIHDGEIRSLKEGHNV